MTVPDQPIRPSSIAFEALPLAAAARALMPLGDRLVVAVLGDQAHWSRTLAAGSARVLTAPSSAPLAAEGSPSALTRAALRPGQAADDAVLETWAAGLVTALQRALGRIDATHVPDQFMRLAGELAWRPVDFQRGLAHQINQYFFQRVLFVNGRPLAPRVAPETIWVLAALAPPELKARNEMVAAAAARVRAMGSVLARRTNWAGFWDQWLVWEAKRRWPEGLGQSGLADWLSPFPLEAAVLAWKAGKRVPVVSCAWVADTAPAAMPAWFRKYAQNE